jgi:hypothetical protein
MKAKTLIVKIVSVLLFSQTLLAAPAQILFIRHAEKLNDKDNNLSEQGYERAEKLAKFFTKNPKMTEYGLPVAIFAAAPRSKGGSIRSIETVEPLARRLGIEINTQFTKKDEDELVEEILENKDYEGGTVVVSWVRQELPDLVKAFGAKGVPKDWDEDTFDRVWRVEFEDGRAGFVEDLPQNLMPGDS